MQSYLLPYIMRTAFQGTIQPCLQYTHLEPYSPQEAELRVRESVQCPTVSHFWCS